MATGSKRQLRPGVWELRAYIGRDPVTRRRRDRSRTFKGTTRQADSALAALVTEVEAQQSRGSDSAFAVLLDAWLELIARDREVTTVREYRRLIEKRVKPALGSVPIDQLTAAHLDTFYGALLADGLASGSVRQIHAVCRRALEQAVLWGWLRDNPAKRATRPRQHRGKVDRPDVSQLWAILDEALKRDEQIGAVIELAANTGARRGELCALRWTDVDLGTGLLTIRHGLVIGDGRGELIEKDTKTHAERVVELGPSALESLVAHRRRREAKAAEGQILLDPGGFVFSRGVTGSVPMHPAYVTKQFAICRDLAGADPAVHLHTMRHLNASVQVAEGVPISEIAARLGHAHTSTTLDIYSHFMPGSRGQGPDAIERGLRRPD